MSAAASIVLNSSIRTRLGSGEVWASRVYPDMAPDGTSMPYVIFTVAGGGNSDFTPDRDNAELRVLIKAVSNGKASTVSAAARISALLKDQGAQEGGAVSGDSNWIITTISEREMVDMTEFTNGQRFYHCGAYYEFVMEAL